MSVSSLLCGSSVAYHVFRGTQIRPLSSNRIFFRRMKDDDDAEEFYLREALSIPALWSTESEQLHFSSM